MNTLTKKILIAAAIAITSCIGFSASNGEAKLHKLSTTIEKERPKLDEETMRLIAAYRKTPSDANRSALKKQVEINYDKIVERKKTKLEDLKKNAKEASKVKEMQDIVDDMVCNQSNSHA